MPRVLVVGGGISGLSAAYTLQQRGVDVVLAEAEPRLGGKILTETSEDFVIDAGPDSFLSTKPAAIQLAQELGIADRLIDTLSDGGGAYILRAGRLRPLPEGITLLVPTDLKSIARTPLLSPIGKLRMAMDYFIPPRREQTDESIGTFVRRRLGREAFERMAEPLLSGIYAGDADQLSLASTFPRLREVERTHGGMVRGALYQRRLAGRAPALARRTPFVSFQCGLGELVDALATSLASADVRVGVSVTAVQRRGPDWLAQLSDGSTVVADGLVLAVPAYAAADVLGPDGAELSTLLREIPWVSTATISLAYPADALTSRSSGRGFVIPRAERRTLTAVTWTSRKFSQRAPSGTVLLRGFVGRAGNESPARLPDAELIACVRTELQHVLGIDANPTFAKIYRWPRALPQYVLGHPERLQRIDAVLASMPNLALIGNSYRGVGIPDCIQDARRQAEALLDRIETSRANASAVAR